MKNNAHQKEAYQNHFSDSLRGLEKSVVSFCEDEKEKSRKFLEWLEGENKKKDELISLQREFFDHMFARGQHFVAKIVDTQKVKKIVAEMLLKSLSIVVIFKPKIIADHPEHPIMQCTFPCLPFIGTCPKYRGVERKFIASCGNEDGKQLSQLFLIQF